MIDEIEQEKVTLTESVLILLALLCLAALLCIGRESDEEVRMSTKSCEMPTIHDRLAVADLVTDFTFEKGAGK
jgi:hypothetical protein